MMKHGGDLLSYKDYYDGELIDFSSNINPLGPPDNLKKKIIDGFQRVESYPDMQYRKLKKSISRYLGCSIENVLVGNGAMEIIDIFNYRANRVITTTPAFSEYKIRGKVHGKKVVEIGYDENFHVNIDELKDIVIKGDLLIIGNPNNPTGLRIAKEELLDIYEHVSNVNAYLLLDEAFYEFAPEDYDSIKVFEELGYKNVGIIRAATKFFAIPGLRLGYGCVEKDLAKEMTDKSLTWSINCFADLAGQIIFDDWEYIEKSKRYIHKEREYLLTELNNISGIRVFDTDTNYILIRLDNRKEDEVFEQLLVSGIVVRKCSSFKSLGDNHIRVAIKDRENNEKLIDAMKKIDL